MTTMLPRSMLAIGGLRVGLVGLGWATEEDTEGCQQDRGVARGA